MMHHTQRLAQYKGKVAFETGLSMAEANPYHRSTKSFGSFERGYRAAEQAARQPA